MEITADEGRVLGCLVEKELTTPQLYPLTDNALVAACNQTTNRDPVVQYDVSAVRLAVRSLREKQLVRTVHRPGERSDKHRHLVDAAWELTPAEVALLAVLLLRGPQTAGELRARTERMHPFPTVEQVQEVLEALATRAEPLVTRLERQPGRKEVRYAELVVSGAPAASASAADTPAAAASSADTPAAAARPPAASATAAPAAPRPSEAASPDDDVAALRTEVAALSAEVAALRADVAALAARSAG